MTRGNPIDMTGRRYGRLTVLSRDGTLHGAAAWLCECECGRTVRAYGPSLRKGVTASCGCLAREIASKTMSTHGRSKTREYRSWLKMRDRCSNPSHHQYTDYGGRGITVCAEWERFEQFLEDMGERPTPLHTLDRLDNEQGYSPANCRWATRKEQSRNTRVVRPVRRSDGKVFLSAGHAVERHGGSETPIRNACLSGRSYRGYRWQYIEDLIGLERGASAKSEAA